MTVDALELSKGDIVVELGCGTGLNFSLVLDAIGPDGKLIGVDITDKMLDQARKRVKENGWRNVELVQSDITEYKFDSEFIQAGSDWKLKFENEGECGYFCTLHPWMKGTVIVN